MLDLTMTPARQTNSSLTPEAITDATLELIDERGLDAITLRELAARCGVGVTTLYGHFRSKEDILSAVVDRLLAELDLPDPTLSWDQRILRLSSSVYRIYAAHPALAKITAAQAASGQAAARIRRDVLAALTETDLTDEEILLTHDVIAAYLTGYVLRESSPPPDRPGPRELLIEIRTQKSSATPDHTTLRGPTTKEIRRFESGLATILRGIANRPNQPSD
jgi:AcrR family transcriptional regulator